MDNLQKIRIREKKKLTNKTAKSRHSACQFPNITCSMYALIRVISYSPLRHHPNTAVSLSHHLLVVYLERISVFSRKLVKGKGVMLFD